ncbi:hypothetical protein CBL_04273 [Carabus blaptoides fortunei]
MKRRDAQTDVGECWKTCDEIEKTGASKRAAKTHGTELMGQRRWTTVCSVEDCLSTLLLILPLPMTKAVLVKETTTLAAVDPDGAGSDGTRGGPAGVHRINRSPMPPSNAGRRGDSHLLKDRRDSRAIGTQWEKCIQIYGAWRRHRTCIQ